MVWFTAYLGISVFVALSAFVLTEWGRPAYVAPREWPGGTAIAVGLIWPLVIVGALQLAFVTALGWVVRKHLRGRETAKVLTYAAADKQAQHIGDGRRPIADQ